MKRAKSQFTFGFVLAAALALTLTTHAQTVTFSNFNGNNGWEPLSSVTQATDGNFYGTTSLSLVRSAGWMGKATVPRGATTGFVSVVTPSGTRNSNSQFLVMQ